MSAFGSSDCNGSVKSFVSSKPSLPESFDYEDCDPEIIRRELTLLGYNPGPVTATTKRVYLKKLKQLKQQPPVVKSSDDPPKRGRFLDSLSLNLNLIL
jgi:hypothetical protein